MKYKINFRHPVIQVGNWGFPGFLNEHLLDSINEIVSNGYAIIGGDSITVYPDAHIETCYVKGDDQYCLQFNYDDSDALENWDKFVLGSKENAIEEISYYISMISNEANKKYKYGMMVTYISESQARKGLKNVKNDNRSKNNKFIGDKINPYFDLVQKMILHERSKLDAWIAIAYANEDEIVYDSMHDVSYDGWDDIEMVVGLAFDSKMIKYLEVSTINSILFFISRGADVGRLISWMSTEKKSPFSSCGNLTYLDFIYLSERALLRPDDFCDYQLAACFEKCESLDDYAANILIGLFNKNEQYTRRRALNSIAHFNLPQTVELAKRLWETDDYEFSKLSCLHQLKKYPSERSLFLTWLEEYKLKFNINDDINRRKYIEDLSM